MKLASTAAAYFTTRQREVAGKPKDSRECDRRSMEESQQRVVRSSSTGTGSKPNARDQRAEHAKRHISIVLPYGSMSFILGLVYFTMPIVSLLSVAIMPRDAAGQQMVFPEADWQVSTPEAMLMDPTKLQQAIDYLAANSPADGPKVSEMVIARNGRVIWQGSEPDQTELVYSVTKSYATTMLGLLIDDGAVSLDTLATDYVTDLSQHYPEVSLRHLATHTSGYLTRDEIWPLTYNTPLPEDSFDPVEPLFSPPGSYFAYSGVSAMDQMMNVLTRAAGEEMQQLFKRRIGDPIGMDPNEWDWEDHQTSDGITVDGGGIGLRVSATDAARLGHLFLNQGKWSDEQLISSDWVRQATAVQIPSDTRNFQWGGTNVRYGYGWWIEPYGFSARGAYNNYIAVDPSLDLVVARMGRSATSIPFNDFINRLRAAAMTAIWDEKGNGIWNEIDADTGKTRWTTDIGVAAEIYPTVAAIVRSNTVTINDDLTVNRLDIESGAVSVSEAATFHSPGRIGLDAGSTLLLDGTLEANSITARGRVDVSETGSINSRNLIAYDPADLTIRGKVNLDRLAVRGAYVSIQSSGELELGSLIQTDGLVRNEGRMSMERLMVSKGSLVLHDTGAPYKITGSLELGEESELQLLMSQETWNSPIHLADGISPELSGTLRLEVAAPFHPKQLEGQTLNLFDWGEGISPSGEFSQVTTSGRLEVDLSQLYSSGEVTVVTVVDKPSVAGDFNGNSFLEVDDVDALTGRIRAGSTDLYYDVDEDNAVGPSDLDFWIHERKQTWFGDANLDGEFNTADISQVLEAGLYETQQYAGWAHGDWNGDGVFDTADLMAALQDGGYETGPPLDSALVPELSSAVLCLVGLVTMIYFRR